MFLLTETFDHTDEKSYENMTLGYTSINDPHRIVAGMGRGGSAAYLFYPISYWAYGLNIFPLVPSKNLILGGYFKIPPARRNPYTTFENAFSITFSYYERDARQIHFTVTLNLSSHGKAQIDFLTADDVDNSEYPAIESHDGFVDVMSGYFLVEISIDLTDAEASLGRAKVALNGKTYADITGIITGDVNNWDNGGNSYNAFLNHISITTIDTSCHLDSVYVCNEGLSYHDDFVGPYDISTLRGFADGDQANWERTVYGELVLPEDTRGNFEFVNKSVFDKEDAESMSVTASQSLVRDLVQFDAGDFPIDTEIIAVNHRLQAKGLALEHFKYPCVVTPVVKPSGGDVSYQSDYEKTMQPFLYSALNAMYDIHPALTTPWTLEFLQNSQFGYCFFETEGVDVLAGQDGYLINGVGGETVSLVTDNDLITCITGSPYAVVSLAVKKNISRIQVVLPFNTTNVTLLAISPDGNAWYEIPRDNKQIEDIGTDWGDGTARKKINYLNPYPGVEVSHVKVYAGTLYDIKAFAMTKVGI